MQANNYDGLAADAMARLAQLASCSEDPQRLTRRYLTPEHAAAAALVAHWMSEAGMSVRTDAAGNLIGRREGAVSGYPALVLGSHLDTVRDAGRYDGALGVVLPVLCVQSLSRRGCQLDYPVEVIAFGDEEGTRFQSTYLGSRAVTGQFNHGLLEFRDDAGISMREAMTAYGLHADRIGEAVESGQDLAGYLEVHIEQGPVLESEDLPVGVVTAISGATRLQVTYSGEAGHAGTVPMSLRRDALAAAAEVVLLVEKRCQGADLVGTVGSVDVLPGAVNVIPGRVQFTVDLRSSKDVHRSLALDDIVRGTREVANRRRLEVDISTTHSASSVDCDPGMSERVAAAVASAGFTVRRLPSGAGHDAAAMAAITPVAMLFVRCWRGLSHHPDESMSAADVAAAARVLVEFMEQFAA